MASELPCNRMEALELESSSQPEAPAVMGNLAKTEQLVPMALHYRVDK